MAHPDSSILYPLIALQTDLMILSCSLQSNFFGGKTAPLQTNPLAEITASDLM